ncbi:MAG: hypothetical protein IKW64_04580 [Clostridia bacterium]|nr:hypothetical protein [Clostridia bacterium]
MSISAVYNDQYITVYCADIKSIFRPYPAKDTLLESADAGSFVLNAAKHGKTVFQIILASNSDIIVDTIKGKGITCFSVEGVDIFGNEFNQSMPVSAGKPWPFWCLLDSSLIDGEKLDITIGLQDGKQISFSISLFVSEEFDSTLSDINSLTRLEWLNSREGTESTLTKDFIPVSVYDRTIKILGRDIKVSEKGFIESLLTYFTGINNAFSDAPREILAAPLEYVIYENGKALDFTPSDFSINHIDDTKCSWQATNTCGEIVLVVNGCVEFDGSMQLNAELKNARGKNLSVRLAHTPKAEFAKYFVGLGLNGCKTPESYFWKWDENKRQDSIWSGSVNGGVFIRPTALDTVEPFVNIYFHHSKNYMPKNWVNDGKGHFAFHNEQNVTMYFDSGEFTADSDMVFCADLMVSPFKKIDLKEHWNTHYYHKNYNVLYDEDDIKDAVSTGCTHINLHHGNDTLPFLNYPMCDMEAMSKIADMAHKNGLGFKPYYTVRELTTRLPELFAFRSLGTEIFPLPAYSQGGVPGQNGVDDYLTENFGDEVIPAWKHVFIGGKYDGTTDPTVVTNPQGRISNFYVGSLAWLIQQIGIDGLYIDDVGYDKNIMRRVRRVFDKYNSGAKIDFHTCNHFEDSLTLGFGYGHNVLIYMGLFPYLTSLWVGEGFDYDNNSAEYLLTEVSGIPFGIMGEMLEGDCNVWRGMLFGMTSRYPYYKNYTAPSPVPVWEVRKPFENAEMIGFWEDEKPIWTDNDQVLCTTYYEHKNERMLCCLANFSDKEAAFKLCGNNLQNRTIYAPYIENIQEEKTIKLNDSISIPAKGGIMLIVE